MRTRFAKRNKAILTSATLVIAAILFLSLSPSANAQKPKKFEPIERGGVYEQTFLDTFWTALGSRPADLSWVKQSETVRLLVTAGAQAVKGDADGALRSFELIPDEIASVFPFLTTMHEDLLAPKVLDPFYKNDKARTMLFNFYQNVWLPHQDYRDDFTIFRFDMMGRASRIDPESPAVWITHNLTTYGYTSVPTASKDDPYLFLWNLLSDISYYAERADYYGLIYDKYNPNDWKIAVVAKAGNIIKAAHDEASVSEIKNNYWSKLIDTRHPFENQAPGAESGGEQTQPEQLSAGSREAIEGPETANNNVSEAVQPSTSKPEEVKPEATSESEEIGDLVQQLESGGTGPEVGPETNPPPAETTKPPEETKPAEEKPAVKPEETPKPPEETTKPPEEVAAPPEEVPNEFEPGTTKPEEATKPSPELGEYAQKRLAEISEELTARIGGLATDLGKETVNLVILYNDANVSKDAISKAEDSYILKRQAFLAGLAVWDRFTMEIYSPLTLSDFDAQMSKELRKPYDDLKAGTQWSQYQANAAKFDEAFSQIETGFRTRRTDSDVQAAEEAALSSDEDQYKKVIEEIQDLLSGKITSAPAP